MNTILAFLQAAEQDYTWNYIILGALVVIGVVLGATVMRKRQQDV